MAGELHIAGEKSHELGEQVLGIGNSSDCGESVTLRTKYFTAPVHVRAFEAHNTLSEQNNEPEACMVLFDPDNPVSQAYALHTASSVHSADVRLLVALLHSVEGIDARASEALANARDWCARNSFELVRVCPHDAAIDEQLFASADEGCERLLAALKSHVWSTAQPVGEEGIAAAPSTAEQLLHVDDKATPEAEDDVHGDAEATDDAMEKLMQQMMQMRQMSASMGDEERRENAASIAQQLMSTLCARGAEDDADASHSSGDEG